MNSRNFVKMPCFASEPRGFLYTFLRSTGPLPRSGPVRWHSLLNHLTKEAIMNAKPWSLLVLLLFAVPTRAAQESVRDLAGPGQYSKFLTPGQLDRWVFEGEKDETIIAHVTSREFDPVLELSRTE